MGTFQHLLLRHSVIIPRRVKWVEDVAAYEQWKYKLLVRRLEKDRLEDLIVDGRIINKIDLNKLVLPEIINF
jgi:hypothetical protein